MTQVLLCAGPGLLVIQKDGLLFYRHPGQPWHGKIVLLQLSLLEAKEAKATSLNVLKEEENPSQHSCP